MIVEVVVVTVVLLVASVLMVGRMLMMGEITVEVYKKHEHITRMLQKR